MGRYDCYQSPTGEGHDAELACIQACYCYKLPVVMPLLYMIMVVC